MLEICLHFFVRHQVNFFMARAAQIDRTALEIFAREIGFFLFMPRARNEMMRSDLTDLTAA
ncbi:MAG: hypothetical protein ETSY1_03805 [Candidatus Entotheonella factor]|uniref:Uncharacterized protein n=1 Tax=Entotheonella factor TaxID=1429438 RepID=W4LWR6_ENTF1|nr:MAG: hypothetical protein ETSY1_03805 [Candidatus Entotheonella factor]